MMKLINVIDTFNIKQYRFSDDSFTANTLRAIEIAKILKPLDIRWRVSVRVLPNDYLMWRQMYKGGCREVSFGIESFDQDILDHLNKKTTIEDNINAIICASEAGLTVRILLMIGTPGQTKNTISKNIEAIEKYSKYITSVSCTAYMPLPGSAIWNNPQKFDIRIINTDFAEYNFYLFGPDGLREMPVAISHLFRDDDEVIKESLVFRDYIIEKGIANEG